MKRLLLALTAILAVSSTAYAADMPVKAAPFTTTTATMFGGFYVGGHGGWATGTVDPGSFDADGFVYGGHAGFQVQKGWLVGGLEAGITNYANVKNSGSSLGCDCIVADLLAKLGVTVTPSTLLYVTGGGFWHNTSGFGVIPQFGWSVGTGLDWLPFNDHFIIGARYLYRDLGGTNLSPVQVTGHEFTGRVSYKF
jgi:outer membrane immunogenic protein